MVWVYKADGSQQCTGMVGTTSAEAKAELAALTGDTHIHAFFQVGLFVVQVCGLPTGICHAANLDDEGFELLMTGVVGPNGWAPWPFSDDPSQMRISDQHPLLAMAREPGVPFPMRAGPEVSIPMKFEIPEVAGGASGTVTFNQGRAAVIPEIIKRLTAVSSSPSTLRDLIGYKLRVVHRGDPDELVYYFGRINIHVDDDDRIVDISFH